MKETFIRSIATAISREWGIALTVVVVGSFVANTSLLAQQPKTLQQKQDQLHEQESDDYENAQRLHILFSDVPETYCKTPAAIQAIATLEAELVVVRSAIRDDEIVRTDVATGGKSYYLVHGKGAEVKSLARILKRLEDEVSKLKALPPCATGYRTVFVNGWFVGIYVIKATGGAIMTERFVATDQITNVFSNSHDPLGAGINLAYAFTPFNNSVIVSPFASVDYLNNSVNHPFPGGSFLGTTANVAGTVGVKVGPSITKDLWLYGIAGLSVLNEKLSVNFLPVMSSTTRNVAGGTLGAGFAFKPGFLQGLGRPISLFAEYQHTWWQDAQFNSPAASPLFNYNFRRSDDVIKLGFNVHFEEDPASPSLSPSFPVKAPAMK